MRSARSRPGRNSRRRRKVHIPNPPSFRDRSDMDRDSRNLEGISGSMLRDRPGMTSSILMFTSAVGRPVPTLAPPVGTCASAVLVDFAGCGWPSSSTTAADEAILHRLRLGVGHRHRRIVARQHVGDRIGGDQIGQPQFGARQSCRSSQGGTLSASDSRSPVPPMSKVNLARRPMSRSTIIRSCAV